MTLAQITQSVPMLDSKICEPVAIRVRSPTFVSALQDHVGLEHDVLGQVHGVVEIHGRRVEHGHARPHPAVVEVHAHVPLGARELRAVVDAGQAPVIVGVQGGHDAPVLACERDEVREVQLAGGLAGPQVADPPPQPRRVDRVQARVDLGDLALLVGRVLVLDDALDRAAVVAHDPPQAARIDRVDRDQRDRRVVQPAELEQRLEQVLPRRAARHPRRRGAPRRRPARRRAPPGGHRPSRAARPGARCRPVTRPPRARQPLPASRRRPAGSPSHRWRRRARGRPSAGRTPGGAPWAGSTSCACRGRPRGRSRPCAAGRAGT